MQTDTKKRKRSPDFNYEYMGVIKNLDKGMYVASENNGKVRHTKKIFNALYFYEEWDAESTLAMLNEQLPDCYQLIDLKN